MSEKIKKPEDPRQFFHSRGIYPEKSLGQNFLTDSGALARIADLAELTADDTVIEIGPGMGALTAALAERAGRVIAFEKDKRIFPHLVEMFRDTPVVELVLQDALQADFGACYNERKMKVAANLPYSVSTPVLIKLLESRDLFSTIVLMLQLEVGERIVAGPGTKKYGSISVLLQTYMDVGLAFRLPPGAFWPRPKVDSAVLKFVPLPKPRVDIPDERFFEKVVRAAFSSRRKMLGNSLKSIMTADEVHRLFESCGIDQKRRAETLSIEEFGLLTAHVADLGIKV